MNEVDTPATSRRGAGAVRILEGQAGSDAAARAMAAYVAELDQRLPTGFDPALATAVDPREVTPPDGDFMLLSDVGTRQVVGFGAVRVVEPGVVEIKRMWLRPDARGQGLGRFLLRSLENRARALGARRVILGVNEDLVEAVELYLSSGYAGIEPFEDNPFITHFLGKRLLPPSS
ncbi:GNAT family N-acetyltransferase [Georgenia faecalis]|uniref:GNAT family N-acetyltransferase n=1 Tax=Georgenia faecalis TaxID=2483799 RepID=A0ABV9DBW2_9MICO|nr:GNAT family N-acetyltransferase [Georgenia faecalis]